MMTNGSDEWTEGDTRDDREMSMKVSMNGLVRVRWLDATHIDDDRTEAKLADEKPLEFAIVGTLVVDDGQKLIIAGTVA